MSNVTLINTEFEARFDEKQQELDDYRAKSLEEVRQVKMELEAAKSDLMAFRNRELKSRPQARGVYEASEFGSSDQPDLVDPGELRRCRQELADLKLQLVESAGKETEAERGLNKVCTFFVAKKNFNEFVKLVFMPGG
jgi:hypothetical protein